MNIVHEGFMQAKVAGYDSVQETTVGELWARCES